MEAERAATPLAPGPDTVGPEGVNWPPEPLADGDLAAPP